MTLRTVTMQVPENVYIRLEQTAKATKQSFDSVFLRALRVGSPSTWESALAELQSDLAALDRLADSALWRVARSHISSAEMDNYQTLLDKNANQSISIEEKEELSQLRTEYDRQMLLKAHAASLLQWRGYQIPPADR